MRKRGVAHPALTSRPGSVRLRAMISMPCRFSTARARRAGPSMRAAFALFVLLGSMTAAAAQEREVPPQWCDLASCVVLCVKPYVAKVEACRAGADADKKSDCQGMADRALDLCQNWCRSLQGNCK